MTMVQNQPAAVPLLTDEDRSWLAENLLRGGDKKTLAGLLIKGGRSPGAVHREIDLVLDHPYTRGALRRLELEHRRLAKAQWTLDLLGKLDLINKKATVIPVIDKISGEQFFNDFYLRNRPCVITGMLDSWPAMKLWRPDHFIEHWGDRIVEVQTRRNEDARYEINAANHQNKMKFGDFITAARATRTNEYYITARNNGDNRVVLTEMWDEIGQLPEYLVPTDPSAGFLWLGPAGTFTPLHHDLTNNFMAQVVGRKRVMLVNSIFQPHIYNNLHVYSRVNLSQIDYDQFPDMRNVPVLEWVLEPGQILFLPIGWWHQVEALDFSATMSFTNFLLDNDFNTFYRANGEL